MMKRILIFILLCTPGFACIAGETGKNNAEGRKFDYFFLEALRLREADNHTGAYNLFQYALKTDSTSSNVLFELSNYYLFLKKDSLALDALQKAVKYSPGTFEYKVALADLNKNRQKFDDAIAIYEELVREYPAKAELNFYLSELYLYVKQIDKAIQSLDDLENNMGINETVSLQKYQLYSQTGKKEEAIKEIEKLSAKFPAEAQYPIIIGDSYLEQNDTINALKYYNQAYRLDSINPYYLLSMARYYELTGKEETVVQEFSKALRNPRLDVDTKLEILGKYIQNLHRNKKDMENANALLETLLEQHSQEKELNMVYGEFLLFQGKTEEAKFQFQIVTEANPENIAAWRHLLTIALRENNTDEIIAVCDGALIHFPDAAEFHFYKGSACYMKKDYTKALTIFREGLKIIPDDNRTLLSNFHGQIGDIYHLLNEKEKAYQSYEKALEYDENNLLILNNYAYFLSLDNKELDKAERMSAKCVQMQPDNATYIDTYAWVFFRKGNYSLARFYIESALSKSKDVNSEIIEHYGDILFMTGNTGKALEEWTKAMEVKEKNGNNVRILKKKINDKTYYEAEE
ncbi:MAG: tetratricopeptide repeat protein [Dysgonamonadaceae bacterium]|jgi:tetratricopeptide (TPR) repeat protein|nr:tetratricopeptide repeat protein [Dysgonamonadaceae bacterium]